MQRKDRLVNIFFFHFFFFKLAIKIAGSALKSRVGRVSGNTGIFRPYLQMTTSGFKTKYIQLDKSLRPHPPTLER